MADNNLIHTPTDPFFYSSPEAEARRAEAEKTMARAYRIRGRMMPLVGALTCLLFAVLVPYWYHVWAVQTTPITLLVLGVLPMILAIPCHVLGGNRGFLLSLSEIRTVLYILGIILNTVGTSLCMTAYYIHLQAKPSFTTLAAAALVSVAVYAVLAVLFQFLPNRYGLLTGVAGLILLVLIIASIVFWVRSDSKIFFSFGFFTLLWTLIAVIALHVACSDEESPWLRFASFAAFGILMAVGAIVLIILACAGGGDGCDCDCGGDCCDCSGCDCGGGGTSGGESSAAGKKKTK
ncbi:MAG: hypothetical protein IJA91_00415 [Clostridia bacterium]|nr:hypothetical protein [Clostridia bacterium]